MWVTSYKTKYQRLEGTIVCMTYAIGRSDLYYPAPILSPQTSQTSWMKHLKCRTLPLEWSLAIILWLVKTIMTLRPKYFPSRYTMICYRNSIYSAVFCSPIPATIYSMNHCLPGKKGFTFIHEPLIKNYIPTSCLNHQLMRQGIKNCWKIPVKPLPFLGLTTSEVR